MEESRANGQRVHRSRRRFHKPVQLLPQMVAMIVICSVSAQPPIDYSVKGTVKKLQQPSDCACWATVATIMKSWKDKVEYTIPEVMKKAGPIYEKKFSANDCLAGDEKGDFLKTLGLRAEPPQSYTVDGWKSLLKMYGILWVTTNEGTKEQFSIHAQVVTGIFGDGSRSGTFLKIIDPADGSEGTEKIEAFNEKFKEVAEDDLGVGAEFRPQVVHF